MLWLSPTSEDAEYTLSCRKRLSNPQYWTMVIAPQTFHIHDASDESDEVVSDDGLG